MTLDERLKLNSPLFLLIGACLAADGLTKDSNFKSYSDSLIKRAKEMEAAWYEVNPQSPSRDSGVKE